MSAKHTLTLGETAERLGRSPRTLEKWMRDGRLKWRVERLEGKPARVFDVGEVERLTQAMEQAEEQTGRFVRPAPANSSEPRSEPVALVRAEKAEITAVRELIGIVRELVEKLTENPVRRKGLLTPSECNRVYGVPARMAVELAEQGRLSGERYGETWRIRRESLEAFLRVGAPERALAAMK